jgi:hypothetical protein
MACGLSGTARCCSFIGGSDEKISGCPAFGVISLPAMADRQKPGKGVSVQPARATWNTGYFQ